MPVTVKSPTPEVEMSLEAGERLAPGTPIEVRTRFDGHWAHGFEVVAAIGDSYRVRRLSDGLELPADIAGHDVRRPRERKRGTWWY